jgi:hypothetical protein
MNYNYLLGANLCIQQSVKLMRKLGIEQGQIININSNCGHRVYSAPGMRYSLPPSIKNASHRTKKFNKTSVKQIKCN